MPTQTKLLLIEFRGDKVPTEHPQIMPFLERGWQIQSIAYRIVEPKTPKLLVKLVRPSVRSLRRRRAA